MWVQWFRAEFVSSTRIPPPVYYRGLKTRVGFGGPFYHNYNKEPPQSSLGFYLGPYSRLKQSEIFNGTVTKSLPKLIQVGRREPEPVKSRPKPEAPS